MATPNYSYEKRQRELAKKRKAEEKRQKKATTKGDDAPADQPNDRAPGTPGGTQTPPAPTE